MTVTAMPDHDSARCAVIRDAFARIGDKWSLLLIVTLSHGPQRFTALRLGIDGISQRMLTLTLRKLEHDGLVRREVFAEVPPRVEYSLTARGESLIGPVTALADWAVEDHRELSPQGA
jgi:DNA-binding HxlR family transcriptional regulator